MKSTLNIITILLTSLVLLSPYNTFSQQIEYNIYAVSGINGNKINDSTIVGGDVGYIAGYWENGDVIQYPDNNNKILSTTNIKRCYKSL